MQDTPRFTDDDGHDDGYDDGYDEPAARCPPEAWYVLLTRISAEIEQLRIHRDTWRAYQMTSPHADAEPNYHEWVGRLYFRTQAVGIRRMLDGDRRTGSLKRLLQKMAHEPRLLQRDWFGENPAGCGASNRDDSFTALADPYYFNHLNPAVPRADLHVLEATCHGIKRFVDQHVTHTQLDSAAATPTPAEIDAALDLLLELLSKYSRLLHRS